MPPNLDDGKSLFKFVVQEGNGVKGLVDSGLQNVPAQFVQPPNERIDKSNAYPHNQAPIDLSGLDGPSHGQVVEAIARAAEAFGFFQVVNHCVPLELLESLKNSAHGFFGQAPEKKAVYLKGVSPSPLVKYGTSFNTEKQEVLDWRDYVSMDYTNDEDALKHWPNECKEVALEYLKTSTKMVKKIVQVLFEHLGVTLDEPRMDALIALKTVIMNFYPTCPNPDLTVGAGRHSDIGILTVLLQDDIGGLYVKLEQEEPGREGKWMEIPPVPDALVINVGDILQIISNGRYKSPEHRVRTTSTQSRVSIPIFILPQSTEKIGPLPELVERDGVARYRELIAGDYVNYYFEKAHKGVGLASNSPIWISSNSLFGSASNYFLYWNSKS